MSQKLSKSDYILKEIIRAYLSLQNPVGSLYLQDSLNVPASTIRMYFKRLSDEGKLSKQHASSGRTPTSSAMRNYWIGYFERRNLSTQKIRVLNDLAFFKLIDKFKLFCMVIDESPSRLSDVICIKEKHLFLEFEDFCCVLPHEEHLSALFSELRGCEASDILQVLAKLQLDAAARAIISAISEQKIFCYGEERLFKMASKGASELLNLGILKYFNTDTPATFCIGDESLLNHDYIALCAAGHYINTPANFIICGSIYTDFDRFFNSIKEVV